MGPTGSSGRHVLERTKRLDPAIARGSLCEEQSQTPRFSAKKANEKARAQEIRTRKLTAIIKLFPI
jgi:hypothetical protein